MTPPPALLQARRDIAAGLAIAAVVTLFITAAALTVPLYDMQLYDRVLQSRNMSTLTVLSLVCLAGLAIYAILDMLRAAAFLAVAQALQRRLHAPVLHEAVRRGFAGLPSAGIEIIRDLSDLRGFIATGALAALLDILAAPLLLGVLYLLHPAYFWLALGGASALLLFGLLGDLCTRAAVQSASAQRTRLGNDLARALGDSEAIEGLGLLPAIARRWAASEAIAATALRHAHDHAHLIAGAAKLVRFALQSGVMVLGAVLILHHETTPGSLMGANLLLNKLLGPFDQLVGSWRQWLAARASWRRLRALAPTPAAHAADAGDATVGLTLRDVGYAAPSSGRPILHGLSLHIRPGRAVAIVGPNGAGKTTLLRLIAGVLPATSGTIRLDGMPIAAIDRVRIGYLPQAVGLLRGSIADNIARFTPAAPEHAVAAARTAEVHDLVGRMRRGYETEVHDTSAAVSGGQRQRLGLARAVFGSPALLVLDEPDASLDHTGDAALRAAIAAVRAAGGIVVLTTHRPQLLGIVDDIVTLRAGRIDIPGRPDILPVRTGVSA